MATDWETQFRAWAEPPSDTEERRSNNAESMVRTAISQSSKLKSRDIKIFTQGSYRNNTNVKGESDIDIGIVCYDTFYFDIPPGKERSDYAIGIASYEYEVFKREVGEALVDYFGPHQVRRGNKAFDIRENTYHTEIDAAPFFEHRRYSEYNSPLSGVELRPDNAPNTRVINWPEQHYQNGVRKNTDTLRRFKGVVRAIKSLRKQMIAEGNNVPPSVCGFLIECSVYNVPNGMFLNSDFRKVVVDTLVYIRHFTASADRCGQWLEVSELKYLFHPTQKWSHLDIHSYCDMALRRVGVNA